MNNIKYHLLNTAGMLIFSFVFAISINNVIRYSISPTQIKKTAVAKRNVKQKEVRNYDFYTPIIESGFFKIASASSPDSAQAAGAVEDLILVGTITGPPAIALAMIKKKSEKDPGVFALIKKPEQNITNEVYGYRLVVIEDKYVKLKLNNEVKTLELYQKPEAADPKSKPGAPNNPNSTSKSLSRAEIQQKVLNNMDNALKGLTAGPHRENNKVVGYKLIRIQPYNILYQYGARTGDIVKRINGHSLDSTEKLYKMWELIKTESKIKIDIDRKGQIMTFDFTITD